MNIVATGAIISWQIDGEIMEIEENFILGGSKITADGDCSLEIKRCLLLGRKAMTNLDSTLRSRDVTLPTKVHLVKAMVFWVVMMWVQPWRKVNTEELMLLRSVFLEKILESLLNYKELIPVILEDILNIHWKDWCWSWSSNTLATWCKELTHRKRPWCWERSKAGEGDNRGWDGWMASPTQWTWVWASSWSWWWDRETWYACQWFHKESGPAEQLNWQSILILCDPVDCSLPGSSPHRIL